MKAIYYIIYRKWNIKKTTWDLDYLDKIQTNEQLTEENCIKSGRLLTMWLNTYSKSLQQKPPGMEGRVRCYYKSFLILTLKNNAHKAQNRTHSNVHGYP